LRQAEEDSVSSEKENSPSPSDIAQALLRLRTGDFSVRLQPNGVSKDRTSVVYQFNELAKAFQNQSQAQSSKKIRKHIFIFSAFSAIVLPVIAGIGPHLLGFDLPWKLLFASILSITVSAINLAIYMRIQNLRVACIVHVAIANLCYGLAIFASGGIQSNLVIFAPLVVMISGLLAGALVVIGSAAFMCIVFLGLEIFRKFSLIDPPVLQTPEILLLKIITCLATFAAIIWLYERIRTKNEAGMAALTAALMKEKAQNDQIMHALDASAIVAMTDVKGRITRVNENFCKISGYSEGELLGQDHRIINSGQHSKEFFVDVWRTISSGRSWTGEIENRSKDGNTYFVQTVITPLTNDEGNIESYMAVRFDVTKEREFSQQLEEAQRVAKIGSWSYLVENQRILWSKQTFELHDEDSSQEPPDRRQLIELVHPDDRDIWLDHFNECLQSGLKYKVRYRIVTKLGRISWLETVAEAVCNRNGQVIKVRGTSQDVTEAVIAEELIKREQHELGTRQRFLDTVLANIPSMILVKDYRNNMRFSLVNKAGEQLLGRESKIMLGKCDHDFYPKDQADNIVMIEREAFIEGKILKMPNELIDTHQGQKIFSTTKVPTFEEDGRPEFLISISNDITDEVHMKEQLEFERAKVVQASKMASLGEISAGIAHEINNPLAIIAGTARALPKFISKPSEFQTRVQMISRSVERIQKIVSGLRKFSRTSGSTEMKLHSIANIAKEAVFLTKVKSQQCGVLVEVDISSDLQILCNEIEIEQVLVNLLNNGIDAVKNLQEKWVKIHVFEDSEEAILEVRDSGPGILPIHREKIFQPFFTTKPVGEGTGLGLAIVKGIIDEHKASIDVCTDSPTTCFVIRFKKVDGAKHAA